MTFETLKTNLQSIFPERVLPASYSVDFYLDCKTHKEAQNFIKVINEYSEKRGLEEGDKFLYPIARQNDDYNPSHSPIVVVEIPDIGAAIRAFQELFPQNFQSKWASRVKDSSFENAIHSI